MTQIGNKTKNTLTKVNSIRLRRNPLNYLHIKCVCVVYMYVYMFMSRKHKYGSLGIYFAINIYTQKLIQINILCHTERRNVILHTHMYITTYII